MGVIYHTSLYFSKNIFFLENVFKTVKCIAESEFRANFLKKMLLEKKLPLKNTNLENDF